MTARDTAAESVASARKNICQALKQWDSSNPASMSESEALLERSATDLKRFHDSVVPGIAPAPAIRLELLNVKSLITRFLRLVDASSAFIGGISGMTADRGIFYDGTGTARQVGSMDGTHSEGHAPCRTF